MATVHARLRALAETRLSVGQILARANVALVKESAPDMFVTVFFGCLDPQTRTLVYASAGHPTGYVFDRTGDIRAQLESTALPLAIEPNAEFPEAGPVQLQPGDTLLLMTDGVAEAVSPTGDYFGGDRMLQTVRDNLHLSAQEILERLYRAVCDFAHPLRPSDDVTVIVIKVDSGAGP